MNKTKPIHVLLIEDDPGDARLVKEALREDTSITFNLIWVDALSKGLEVLGKNSIDAVLLDLGLPDSSGEATFKTVKELAPRTPIILLTGTDDQTVAARVVQEGAQDYLIKGQADHRLLIRSIQYAIERGRLVANLQESEQKYRELVENSIDGIVLINENGEIIEWNAGEERITGLKRADVAGRQIWEIMYQMMPDHSKTLENQERTRDMFSYILKEGQNLLPGQSIELDIQLTDGTRRTIEMMFYVFKTNQGFKSGSITRDITERKRAEKEIKSLARFPGENPSPILRLSQDGAILYANEASQALLQDWGCTMGGLVPNDLRALVTESLTSQSQSFIDVNVGKRIYSFVVAPIWDSGYVNFYGRDITERKLAEGEIRHRVAQLEAVNRISTAMRAAQTLDDLLTRLMDEILAVLGTNSGMILLYDPSSSHLLGGIDRGWFEQLPQNPVKPSEGIAGKVFASGEVYISYEFANDALSLEEARSLIPKGWGGVCLPIRNANETVGILFVSVALPRTLNPEEIQLLMTVAEIAGNAIHRTRLNEQTITRLEHLTALRAIDMAISSSLDLHFILDVVLEQVKNQLNVDATDILLFNPHSHTLGYAGGRGFLNRAGFKAPLRMGEDYAGRALVERATIQASSPLLFSPAREPLMEGEGFVTYFGIPLHVKGKVKGVMEIFHRSPLDPEPEWQDFLGALAGQAAIAIDNAELFDGLQRSNLELSLAYDATIEGWSRAMDLRDKETEGHTRRVAEITLYLARLMGFDEEALIHIWRGALLHDIGKMGTPDRILLKPGPLDAEEWEIMRQHPNFAHQLLSPISFLQLAQIIPYCHHEKWDGSGYPRGLKGEEIPIEARIFAIVDVWDALNSDRPYRKAWSNEQIVEYIEEQTGKHFDPSLVSLFLRELSNTNGWEKLVDLVTKRD